MTNATANDIREIEKIHVRWIELEIAGKIHDVMALCADDIELQPPDAQPVVGRAAVSAWMARGGAKIHGIEISGRSIRGSNEVAYLTANYKTAFSSKEDSSPKESRGSHQWILRKKGEKWAVVLVSWSKW